VTTTTSTETTMTNTTPTKPGITTDAGRTRWAAPCDSPVGVLTLVADDDALVAVLWPDEPVDRVAGRTTLHHVSTGDHPVLAEVERQLREYFEGGRTTFDVPLRPAGTAFQLAAWDVLRTIPFGSTMSYGEQATRLGGANKARAVGAANGRNPIPILVPCHRVTGSDGSLTGFAGGLDAKRWLLEHERRQATLF
jgi:methylated-DNA-[protein]-cysteine S-methyltransferase